MRSSVSFRHHCGPVRVGVGPNGRGVSASVARSRSAGLAGSGTTAPTRYLRTHGATGVTISAPTRSWHIPSSPVPCKDRTQAHAVRLSPAVLCVLCRCAGGAPSGGSGDALSLSVGILTPVYNRGGLWPQLNATSASLGAPTATPSNKLPVAGAIRRSVASTEGIGGLCVHVVHW